MSETRQQEAPTLEQRGTDSENQYRRSIFSMEVTLSVVIGTTRLKISDMLKLTKGSLIPLASKVDDPVDLCADGRILARGELVEVDDVPGQIGLKITEIVDINEAFEE